MELVAFGRRRECVPYCLGWWVGGGVDVVSEDKVMK